MSSSYHKSSLYNPSRPSYMQRSTQLTQTDRRIQQIKRKYDTPNKKDKLNEWSKEGKSQEKENYGTASFQTKSFVHYQSGHQKYCQREHQKYKQPDHKADQCLRQSKANNIPTYNSFFNKQSLIGNKNSNYRQKEPQSFSSQLYKNQNQQDFFKRVKQMKESLLSSGKAGNNFGLKSSQYYQKLKARQNQQANSSFYDSTPNEIDRICNIDKINSKIRGILQTLNIQSLKNEQPYQRKSFYQQKYQRRDFTRTPTKRIDIRTNQRHQTSEILEKIQINKNSNQRKREKQQEEKWERLSSKIQKYQLENKLRLQKILHQQRQQKQQRQQRQQQQSHQQVILKIQPKPFLFDRSSFGNITSQVDQVQVRSKSILTPSIIKQRAYQRDISVHTKNPSNYQMKNGKKLDDQIGRINRKIQQFQEQKKRMNIQFKPYSYSNSKYTLNHNQQGSISKYQLNHDKQISIGKNANQCNQQNEQNQHNSHSLYSQHYRNNSQNTNYHLYGNKRKQNQKKQVPRFSVIEDESQTFRQKNTTNKDNNERQDLMNSKIQIKLQHTNLSTFQPHQFSNKFQQFNVQSNFDDSQTNLMNQNQKKNQNLKKQTDQGIQQRRKKLLKNYQSNSNANQQIKTLVNNLCQQVRIDQEFRNAKIWYQYCDNPSKENQIQKLLPQRTLKEIKSILKVHESQQNPFFSVQSCTSNLNDVADLLQKSEQHWSSKIYKKYDKTALQLQGFTQKQINLEKKDYISLGDMVTFLNLESGTFYRNRDLALVFVRISKQFEAQGSTQVSFSSLIQAFCQ